MRERRPQKAGTATAAAAAVLWTLVVLLFLFVPIGDQQTLLPCMGLVGRSAACEAGQQAVNDAWWWLHTLPMLVAMAAGYAAIGLLAIRARRRGAPDQASRR